MSIVTRRFAVGELIAQKYLLLNLLGRGASGEVYRARNVVAGNVLALKLLMEESGRDSELVQRFFREARAINRVGHVNIVSVFDAGFADGVPYLAMEYLGGEPLGQTLERTKKLPLPCVVAIMARVLDALAAAHQAHIVHRDLKPANVFLQATPGGVPIIKLLDFGVAKIREEGEASLKTESGMILGTPDYLSPEQITTDTEIDGRADLFSAGSLMFELLTGRRPFHSSSFVTTTYRIVHEPPPSLASLGGPTDEAVAKVVARAMCKSRDERYATAEEFAHELGALCPNLAERDAGLVALQVRSTTNDEPWTFSTRKTPVYGVDVTATPTPVKSELRRLPVGVRETLPTPPVVAPRRKPPRSWSDLPIVGRRKLSQTATGKVRGTVLIAIDRAIATRYGSDVREEIVESLPRDLRETLRKSTVKTDAWYSVEQLESYVDGSNSIAVHGHADRWHALGYAGVETDLLTLLRSARAHGDAEAALRAVLPICSGLFDFGRWTLENDENPLCVRVTGIMQLPTSIHDWIAGVLEHASRSTGHPYRVLLVRGQPDAEDAPVDFIVHLRA
jgi:serine/threonine protein kinase